MRDWFRNRFWWALYPHNAARAEIAKEKAATGLRFGDGFSHCIVTLPKKVTP
jgi:hypothetical protein